MKITINRIEMAQRVAEALQDIGVSASEVAKKTGICTKTAEGYMSGLSAPNLDNMAKICKAFDLSADWLMLGRDQRWF